MIRYWKEDTKTEIGRPFDLEKHDKEISDKWLEKIIETREEIDDLDRYFDNDCYTDNTDPMFKCNEVLEILDKLIAESEE